MAVVLVSTDLMASSRIEGAAARLGVPLRTVANVGSITDLPIVLLIVDLASLPADIATLVKQVKAGTGVPPRILAFGPHVHDQLLAAAADAGCEDVLTRGQFFAGLDAILAKYARPGD